MNPLPFRPLPVHDELLSSWIRRLARANHCSVEELCGYLGVGEGRVPEYAGDLCAVGRKGNFAIPRGMYPTISVIGLLRAV